MQSLPELSRQSSQEPHATLGAEQAHVGLFSNGPRLVSNGPRRGSPGAPGSRGPRLQVTKLPCTPLGSTYQPVTAARWACDQRSRTLPRPPIPLLLPVSYCPAPAWPGGAFPTPEEVRNNSVAPGSRVSIVSQMWTRNSCRAATIGCVPVRRTPPACSIACREHGGTALLWVEEIPLARHFWESPSTSTPETLR